MAAGSRTSLLLAVALLCLPWPQEAGAFPTMSLPNMFANAVLRAQHLHQLVADTYKEFERMYIPEGQRYGVQKGKGGTCFSENIPTPSGKDEAQKTSDSDLLHFSLLLIQPWRGSMQSLGRVFTNSLVFGISDRVRDKLKDLENGLLTLAQVLGDSGSKTEQILRQTYDSFDTNLRSDDPLLANYKMLSCFKKDLHKTETYLRVLNCRHFGESGCTF